MAKMNNRMVARRKSGVDSSTSVTTDRPWSIGRSRRTAWIRAGMIASGR